MDDTIVNITSYFNPTIERKRPVPPSLSALCRPAIHFPDATPYNQWTKTLINTLIDEEIKNRSNEYAHSTLSQDDADDLFADDYSVLAYCRQLCSHVEFNKAIHYFKSCGNLHASEIIQDIYHCVNLLEGKSIKISSNLHCPKRRELEEKVIAVHGIAFGIQ